MGQRLMRIAGSPLGQPSLSPASGILLSYIFCHPENNGTGLRQRVSRGGEDGCAKPGDLGKGGMERYWDREMGG